jgi:hypothetical protein
MPSIAQTFAEKRQTASSLYLESMKSMETATMSLLQNHLVFKVSKKTNMNSINLSTIVTQHVLKKET